MPLSVRGGGKWITPQSTNIRMAALLQGIPATNEGRCRCLALPGFEERMVDLCHVSGALWTTTAALLLATGRTVGNPAEKHAPTLLRVHSKTGWPFLYLYACRRLSAHGVLQQGHLMPLLFRHQEACPRPAETLAAAAAAAPQIPGPGQAYTPPPATSPRHRSASSSSCCFFGASPAQPASAAALA